MIDLKLTPAGDMDTSNFDLKYLTGGEQVVQRMRVRLLTFLGEVDLNTQAGVPWFEEILGVRPLNLNRAEAVMREAILNDKEVETVESFTMDYTAATRRYTLAFSVISIYGPLSATIQSAEVG